MEKKIKLNGNKVFKIAVVLLITAMLTGVLVSNTLAKYTTSFSGSDTARVARFEVTSTGFNEGAVDLFDFTYGTSVTSTENVLAPGTSGSIELVFDNASEVSVAVSSLTLSETNAAGVPIEYSVDNTNFYAAGAAALDSALASVLSETLAPGESTSAVSVYWRWVFSSGAAQDAADTALGLAGTAQVTVTLSVKADQVAA